MCDNLLTEEMGHTATASSKHLKVVLKSPSNKFVCMEKRVHIKYNIMKKWSRNADYYNFQSNSGEKNSMFVNLVKIKWKYCIFPFYFFLSYTPEFTTIDYK